MTAKQALKIALDLLRKEARTKRQFYEMYERGWEWENAGFEKYRDLREAIDTIKAMIEAEND